MKKHFYSDILDKTPITQVLIELESTNMKKSEKEHLASIFYSSIHVIIIDVVLSDLPQEHKKTFLSHLHSLSHDKVLNFVKEKTQNIESKIAHAVEITSKEFLADIQQLKKK